MDSFWLSVVVIPSARALPSLYHSPVWRVFVESHADWFHSFFQPAVYGHSNLCGNLTFGLVVGPRDWLSVCLTTSLGHWPAESRRESLRNWGILGRRQSSFKRLRRPPLCPGDQGNLRLPSRGAPDVAHVRYGLFALLRMRTCRCGDSGRPGFSRGTWSRRRARAATLGSAVRGLAGSRG